MADTSLILKKDWDSVIGWEDTSKTSNNPPVYIKNESYFKIKDFLVRREKGSLIVSGERGAGKTTTVMTLLRDLGDNIFPVYVNALHLESIKDDSKSFLNTIEIIKELISQYSREIEKRPYHKDKSLGKLLTLISATSFIRKEYISSEGSVGVESNLSLGASNAVVAATVGLKSALKESFKDEEIFVKAGYSIEDYSRDFSEIIENLELNTITSKFINFKKTFKNGLSFNVNLNKSGKGRKVKLKTVFIIDELDYYDGDGDANKPGFKEVLDAIKKLKNLLTLSGAHFIFITGRKAYRHAINPVNDYNTLFSERVFVVKPNGEELSLYLKEVVPTVRNSEKVEIFKWLLIEDSGHNYFQLEQAIKSRQKIENEAPILKLSINETEEKVALVHAAMDTIYTHFMKIGLFEHHSELLFNELTIIKDNFDSWIHAEGLVAISLAVDSGDVTKPIIRNYIKNAKRSFIRYLFKISETDAPAGLEDLTLEEIMPPWDKLKSLINLSAVKKGITGAITDDEIEVLKLSNQILNSVNTKLKTLKIQEAPGIVKALEQISNSLMFPIDIESIKSIEMSVNSINEKLFYERNPITTKASLELLKTILQSLDSRFIVFKNYLFRVDSGQAEVQGERLILRSDCRLMLLGMEEDKLKNFEVKFQMMFPEEGLLNLLAVYDASVAPADKYYMFRLDTRGPNDHKGNGILLKDKNAPSWLYIDSLGIKREAAVVKKAFAVKINVRGNVATFSIRKKQKGRFTTVDTITSLEEPKQLGFLLEVGEAELTEFVIQEKRDTSK